jgi:VIT1/CCC1 family predicted Fe2+/Mn2+ transporter
MWTSGVVLTLGGAVLLVLLAIARGSWEHAVAAVLVVGFTLMLAEVRNAADDVP